MILLGSLIVLFFLVVPLFAIGGWENFVILFDLYAFLCVLIFTAGYILVCGTKRFFAGLPAILRRPSESRTDVADYYRGLAGFTLAYGTGLAFFLAAFSADSSMFDNLELRKQMLTTAICLLLYPGWLSLLFFLPIAFRFSHGTMWSECGLGRFLSIFTLLGFCVPFPVLLFLVFQGMCVNWLGISSIELIQTIAENFRIFDLMDVLGFVCVFVTITALRLGMGRLQNRFVWIPICIIVGVLWSLYGVSFTLPASVDSEPFALYLSCMFTLCPTLYGFICALAVIVNRAWFFTTLGAVFAICTIVSAISSNRTEILEMPIVFALAMMFLAGMWCALGRFGDMFYLSVTRHESFSGLFSKHKIDWIVLPITLVIFLSLFNLLGEIVGSHRANAGSARCVSNLEQIGIALHNYHEQHGTFPPAYTVDAEGNPLHSWRTLILPYFAPDAIEPKWKDIYDQIRFDEPWDSEHNQQFCGPDNMPDVYGCQLCCAGAVTGETMYKMFVGDNAIGSVAIDGVAINRGHGRGYGTSLSQITRPLDEVAAVVESGLPVLWMSPSDFTVDKFQTAVFANNREKFEIRMAHYEPSADTDPELAQRQILGGEHRRELHVLFADGTVRVYGNWTLSLSELEAMSRLREGGR